MNRRTKESLDKHITGNYGEDQLAPTDAQFEIQRIHQEMLEQALVDQKNEDFINVSFSKKELEAVCEFMNCFAYD